MFAISSVLTPFFMGTVVGAVASGRVPADGGGDRLTSWTGATSLVVGALFVATCAYLAAVFLVARRTPRRRRTTWSPTSAVARWPRALPRGCSRSRASWCCARTRDSCSTA